MSAVGVADRAQQYCDRFGRELGLREEPDRRTRLDQIEELVLGVSGDQDEMPRVAARVADQLPRHVEAVLAAEIHVEEGHIRTQFSRATDRLHARRRDAYDPDALLLEQHARSMEEAGIVIDDQAAQDHELRLGAQWLAAIAASRHPTTTDTGQPKPLIAAALRSNSGTR
jgi:hypothetical protein